MHQEHAKITLLAEKHGYYAVHSLAFPNRIMKTE